MSGLTQLFSSDVSASAAAEQHLFFALTALATLFTCGVLGSITYMAIRYRAGSLASREAPPNQNLKLELALITVALVLGVGTFAWGAKLYFSMFTPPNGAIQVYALGKQWMWKLYHQDGRSEINELHVPRGVPVVVTMASQDVIHDFFLPAFRVKMDVVPGRYTRLWFQPKQTGRYHMFCAQYCGTDHSVMRGDVIVMEPEQFAAWNAGDSGAGTIESRGETVYKRLGCESCHASDDSERAPQLAGLFGRVERFSDGAAQLVDENYLRESITEPNHQVVAGYPAVMPSFAGQINEEELLSLVAYLKSMPVRR